LASVFAFEVAEGIVGTGHREQGLQEREYRLNAWVEPLDATAQLVLDLQRIVPFLDVELRSKKLKDRTKRERVTVGSTVTFKPVAPLLGKRSMEFV